MAKIIFITGGAKSGKARWAVNYFGRLDDVMYMCVYDSLERDIADRIKYNCDKNGISWVIREGSRNLSELVKGHKFAILDNLAEYTNRIVLERCGSYEAASQMKPEIRKEIEKQITEDIIELIWEVKEINGTLLIISVELSFCPVPDSPYEKVYRKILSNVNQRIANQSLEAYLMVCGIPSKIK
ncbi:MAG: bifunctional adenosylcobinamide kinase/adenosylcobinamide-phosphate guanylyltransferase [Oscillospiraceae bacterium]|nr:bifunctional adenosylcobinamide kinase/adenosylcobinamide-phosphate guanylyltransferase [Oscillospiraceae bacterium]